MVPEGWSIKPVGEVLERVVRPVKIDLEQTYREIGIRSHGRGLFDKEPVTGTDIGGKRVFWVEPNCFVVNIVFAWEQAVGKTTDSDAGKIASHRFPMYRPRNGRCDIDFIHYFFKTPRGKHLLGLASPGGAGRNKTLGQKEFDRVPLLLPPVAEQSKIAEILSVWDRAIEVVEQLIENSVVQKKALMQELFSGGRRLAGFKEAWRRVPVRRMGKVVGGGTPDSSISAYWGGDVLWATPTDITSLTGRYIHDTKRKLSEAGLKDSAAKLMPHGTVLVCTRATIGVAGIAGRPISTNQGFKNLIPNKEFDSEFVFFLFQFNKHKFERYANGSTFLELSKSDFEKLTFPVPELNEQAAIARAVADADEQIWILKDQHEHLRYERDALMQQLLTGKRRVKRPEVVA